MGKVISADGDNFVCYSRYGNEYTVTKGLFMGYSDSEKNYQNEIEYQTILSEKGFAPRLIKKDIKANKNGKKFVMWISEDAGLPIEESDIPACNEILDKMYDEGFIPSEFCMRQEFVKGFDGKIRMTDFKFAEYFDEPIEQKYRVYVK